MPDYLETLLVVNRIDHHVPIDVDAVLDWECLKKVVFWQKRWPSNKKRREINNTWVGKMLYSSWPAVSTTNTSYSWPCTWLVRLSWEIVRKSWLLPSLSCWTCFQWWGRTSQQIGPEKSRAKNSISQDQDDILAGCPTVHPPTQWGPPRPQWWQHRQPPEQTGWRGWTCRRILSPSRQSSSALKAFLILQATGASAKDYI